MLWKEFELNPTAKLAILIDKHSRMIKNLCEINCFPINICNFETENGNSAYRIVSAELRKRNMCAEKQERNCGKEICIQNSLSGMDTRKSARRTAIPKNEIEILHAE